MNDPLREVETMYTCRCVMIRGTRENSCDNQVPVDQPFCTSCESRHASLPSVMLGETRVEARLPRRVS